MQQPRQRNKAMNSIDTSSPYFTQVGGQPPPPPPEHRHSYQQYNGYPGYQVDAAKVSANSFGGSPYSSYSSQQQQQPQAHSAELKPSRPSGGRGGGMSMGTVLVLFLMWTGALAGGGYYWWTQIKEPEIKREKHNLQHRMQTLEEENSEIERKRVEHGQQVVSEMDQLRQQHEQHERQLRQELEHSNARIHQVEQESVYSRQHALELIDQTNRAVQDQSKRLVLQKYGAGPFNVEFEIAFPGEDHTWFFTVELAPLDEMPHTVHIFLEQVSVGLYNYGSFSFHHNGAHIAFGSPEPNFRTHEELRGEGDLRRRFLDSGFGGVLFQEYSHNFPHQKYTLGFAGRKPFSGPDFYINMDDNTQNHGPGGYAQDGSPDPCFAKIVAGHDVVNRIHGASGELGEDDWKEVHGGPVAIVSAKLVH